MIVKGLRLRKPCLWSVEKNFAYYTPFIIPPILPYKYPYITIIIFFYYYEDILPQSGYYRYRSIRNEGVMAWTKI